MFHMDPKTDTVSTRCDVCHRSVEVPFSNDDSTDSRFVCCVEGIPFMFICTECLDKIYSMYLPYFKKRVLEDCGTKEDTKETDKDVKPTREKGRLESLEKQVDFLTKAHYEGLKKNDEKTATEKRLDQIEKKIDYLMDVEIAEQLAKIQNEDLRKVMMEQWNLIMNK